MYLCRYFTTRTHVTLLGLNNLEFHVKFGSSNTHCILQAARMSPSTQPPLKWNLHCIKKAYNCYVRHNSACTFSLFCYLYVKSLVLKALSLSLSQHFLSFSFSSEFLDFTLMCKWNLSCTAIDSLCACRQVI